MQTECLVARRTGDDRRGGTVRFLHLTARQVGELTPPLAEWPGDAEPPFRPVETLRVGDRLFHTWQEAVEREVALGELTLARPGRPAAQQAFAFPARRRVEPLREPDGEDRRRPGARAAGRSQGPSRSAAGRSRRDCSRLTRDDPEPHAAGRSRPGRPRRGPAACAWFRRTPLLGVRDGEFVSLLDPPEAWREAAAACRNVGTWPVLVGEEGQKDTMLSSPIILYDYPQVAPESPGDLFDGTEIDEILTLRILTLTDEEKRAMAAVDERAGALLAADRVAGPRAAARAARHGSRTSGRVPTEDSHE